MAADDFDVFGDEATLPVDNARNDMARAAFATFTTTPGQIVLEWLRDQTIERDGRNLPDASLRELEGARGVVRAIESLIATAMAEKH